MQIIVLDQKWDFMNESAEVDRLFGQLQNYIQSTKHIVASMVIDGIEVYDDSYNYIVEHIEEIQSIEVHLLTLKQYSDELFQSTGKYINRVLLGIENLITGFYQSPTDETWASFNELLEGLQWILEALDSIKQSEVYYQGLGNIEKVIVSLQSEISHLEEALIQKDLTLIGDILNYEISPILESILTEVKAIIEQEVVVAD